MAKHEASRFLVRILRSRFRDHKTELSELQRHIRRGDIVCDIGANKGSFLYWLARWSAPGRVIAFEPQPDLAERLARLCSRFSLDNVVVEPRAVYSRSSRKTLFVPEGHQPGASLLRPAETSKAIQVQTTSLDDYLPDTANVSAIKIDVEGAELDVLRGAERTLRRCRPLIVVECDRRLATLDRVKETFLLLRGLGYRGQFLSRGRLLPLSAFDPEIHQRADGEWFWKRKDYCNNFIFRSVRAPTSCDHEAFLAPIETTSPGARSRPETVPRQVAQHHID
ncbi:FkbM family methyltransferase [Bradyrhizobium sp. SZCCHNRI1058]|uniref:FkbM family methyltransferase n=1 Tax=Bradyrhizobium sp. SZCCHNRI1058 TaxID=3057279 RepID=UPI00291659D7|nr:FkbM family methyltransferase [Bradyrhizobium sp. SZCCHNRI1058]